MGGGQTCDINKAVGATFRKAFISVPTSLATDAPTSTHTIINNEGQMPYLMIHYKNPDYVVVDTEITINAPLSMFISGIGDALAVDDDDGIVSQRIALDSALDHFADIIGAQRVDLFCVQFDLGCHVRGSAASRHHDLVVLGQGQGGWHLLSRRGSMVLYGDGASGLPAVREGRKRAD